MKSNLEQRIDILRQMAATFDREPTEDYLKGFLTITRHIPLDSFRECVERAIANSGAFPPGPGDILTAWHWKSRHESPLPDRPRESGPRIGPGQAVREIAATVGGFRLSQDMAAVVRLAEQVRAEGRLVPSSWTGGRLLAHVYAARQIGLEWPLESRDRERLDQDMRLHEAQGGDASWWWEESASR